MNNNFSLSKVINKLCEQSIKLSHAKDRLSCALQLPSRHEIIEIMEDIRYVLFPHYFERSAVKTERLEYKVGYFVEHIQTRLEEQISRGLCFLCDNKQDDIDIQQCKHKAKEITRKFLEKLPYIQEQLFLDILAAYEGDPAAKSPDEVVLCYPGMFAITHHRVAHELYKLNVPIIPRIISEYAHTLTGVDIHPGATIGKKFFIDHGTGVVIGETSIIGDNVRIYQGVTLGAKSFSLGDDGKPVKGIPRHPIVEDNVIIYAGATILGRITIGANSIIGSNVWITSDVPPNSVIKKQ